MYGTAVVQHETAKGKSQRVASMCFERPLGLCVWEGGEGLSSLAVLWLAHNWRAWACARWPLRRRPCVKEAVMAHDTYTHMCMGCVGYWCSLCMGRSSARPAVHVGSGDAPGRAWRCAWMLSNRRSRRSDPETASSPPMPNAQSPHKRFMQYLSRARLRGTLLPKPSCTLQFHLFRNLPRQHHHITCKPLSARTNPRPLRQPCPAATSVPLHNCFD